mgnify:CR=1 FL=1
MRGGLALAVREAAREPRGAGGSREPPGATPDVDDRAGADALDELGDEIVRLAAHLHAGAARAARRPGPKPRAGEPPERRRPRTDGSRSPLEAGAERARRPPVGAETAQRGS